MPSAATHHVCVWSEVDALRVPINLQLSYMVTRRGTREAYYIIKRWNNMPIHIVHYAKHML